MVARLATNPAAAVPAKTKQWMLPTALALTFLIPGITNCGSGSHSENGFSNPTPIPITFAVSPSSITLVAGSTTTFTVSPSPPQGVSVVWSVNPSTAGTITSSGVFTASAAGTGTVIATLMPSDSSVGSLAASAMVTVLPPVALNPGFTEASGGIQSSDSIQNGVVVGEDFPSVTSTDPTGKEKAISGFPIPVPCPQSNPKCD